MPEEPDSSIMDMANDTRQLYDAKCDVYDQWIEQGDRWSEDAAFKQALSLARYFAREVEHEMRDFNWKYRESDIHEAARDIMADFPEYREYEIERRVKHASRKPSPEDLQMTKGDIEHAENYDKLARRIGIEKLIGLIPVPADKVRQALLRGDKHLTSIKWRLWQNAVEKLRVPGIYVPADEKVMALKHVARFYYA